MPKNPKNKNTRIRHRNHRKFRKRHVRRIRRNRRKKRNRREQHLKNKFQGKEHHFEKNLKRHQKKVKSEDPATNNSRPVRLAALIIGLVINVFGNSLTISSDMGAEPWTAAAVGFSKLTPLSVGRYLIIFGILGAIFNQVLLGNSKKVNIRIPKHWKLIFYNIIFGIADLVCILITHQKVKLGFQIAGVILIITFIILIIKLWKELSPFFKEIFHNFINTFTDKYRFVEEVLYIFIFGNAVDDCTSIMNKIGLDKLSMPLRIAEAIIGVTLFCIAISIYQRANIFMHPNDDTSNLLRFKLLNGNAILSQIVDIIPAIIIFGICGLILQSLSAVDVGIGTIYSIIANGFIVKYSDRWIWPSLTHNKKRHRLF